MTKQLLKNKTRSNCNDCNAAPGELHELGCDVERCPRCGLQLIGCECYTMYPEDSDDAAWDEEALNREGRLPWTGIMFEREMKFCEKHDLWTKFTSNGWEKTTVDDPEATHDINTAIIKIHIHGEKE